jgi:hypothetical protein
MPNAKPTVTLLLLACLVAACGAASPTPSPATTVPVEPVPATAQPELATAQPGPATVEPEPTAVPGGPSAAAAAGVLVTYQTRGGECPQGPCGMTAVIHRDGTVERSDGMAQQVDARTLARLADLIAATDWAAILAVPFTGECPVNFDGQEQIYTFSAAGQAVEVASCTTQVDQAAEPFATVQGILFGTGG